MLKVFVGSLVENRDGLSDGGIDGWPDITNVGKYVGVFDGACVTILGVEDGNEESSFEGEKETLIRLSIF